MNAHSIPTAEEPAGGQLPDEWTKQRVNMRSLALNLRKHSHRYRQWSRDEAAKGHKSAAQGFAAQAQKYASDALWYWMRAKQENNS